MPEYQEIYAQHANQYDALVSREDYQQNILRALREIIPLADLTTVELGAGTGRLTCLLAPEVTFIHAFDASQHMLGVAAHKLNQSGLKNWQVMVGEHRSLPAETGLADLVISGWSVCYVVVENPQTWQFELERVLAEMRRVTRPGGTIIILETLGTGGETPNPPVSLVPYFEYLEAHGFQRAWIRTDYRFENPAEAQELTRFFFGEEMLGKISGVMLPECTGIWWRKAE